MTSARAREATSFSSIVKQLRLRPCPQTCAIAPLLVRRRACRLFQCPSPQPGLCGTRWQKGRFRDPSASQADSPLPFESQRHTSEAQPSRARSLPAEPGPRKQPFACVPHADGFIGLLDAPGSAACAHSPRSCVLTPGHSLVPSAPSAVVRPERLLDKVILKTSRAGKLCGPPRPVPRRRTTAARSVSVRDADKIFRLG